MPLIRAAVFDLDGTLLRTEHIQLLGWNIALGKHNKHLSRKQYCRFAGMAGKTIEKELLSLFNLSSLVKPGVLLSAKEKFIHHYFSAKSIRWMPHARSMLRLCKLSGLRIGLATSGKRVEMMKKLKRLNARLHFDALVCLDDVARGKPHPDLYAKACRRLHVSPSAALAFEDTSSGVLSASRAGLRVIAIPTLYSRGQDFSKALAICKSFKEAMALVKTHTG